MPQCWTTWIFITYGRWKYKERTAFLFWFPPFDPIFSDFTQTAIWYLADTPAACQCSWPRVSRCVAWESDAEPTWLFYNPRWEHNVNTFFPFLVFLWGRPNEFGLPCPMKSTCLPRSLYCTCSFTFFCGSFQRFAVTVLLPVITVITCRWFCHSPLTSMSFIPVYRHSFRFYLLLPVTSHLAESNNLFQYSVIWWYYQCPVAKSHIHSAPLSIKW